VRSTPESAGSAGSAARSGESADIDALMLGALYGELTPSEQASFTAHLEAHPADRQKLDQLGAVRSAIRDSAVLDRHMEPPQAISALLLQQAAVRAPKRVVERDHPGWMARFVASLVAHPAIASVASLVLVVGVAGTLYVRSGGNVMAEQTAVSARQADEPAPVPESVAPAQAPSAVALPMPSGADVNHDDYEGAREQISDSLSDGKAGSRAANANVARRPDVPSTKVKPTKAKTVAPSKTPAAAPATKSDEARSSKKSSDDLERAGGAAGAVGGAAPKDVSSDSAQSQSESDAAPRGRAFATAPRAPIAQAAPAPASLDEAGAKQESLPWERATHARLLALLKSGQCESAASLAEQLKNRAPEYFASHLANDAHLGACLAHLAEASRQNSSKGAKAGQKAGAAAAAEAK